MSTEFDSSRTSTAFGLVCTAAAATALGAAGVFFPQLSKLATASVLASSLGFAAGVMLYVSMVDIYNKSINGFIDSGHTDEKAYIWTTLTFFAGIFLMKGLNIIVQALARMAGHDRDLIEQGMEEMVARNAAAAADEADSVAPVDEEAKDSRPIETDEFDDPTTEETNSVDTLDETQKSKLFSMGAATACAIALHNFPEGLVTFIGYVSDPAVGVALAIAIATHNIPEGLCVAMPMYYATGNKWKGFWWGTFSGFSEPLGALIGWLVVGRSFSGNTFGILFGLVAGIMVYICIDELLPTAYHYNPTGNYVMWTCIFGMILISFSLIMFSV